MPIAASETTGRGKSRSKNCRTGGISKVTARPAAIAATRARRTSLSGLARRARIHNPTAAMTMVATVRSSATEMPDSLTASA